MTAVAAARPLVRRLALSADACAVLALVVVASAVAVLTLDTWGDLGRDTGYDLVAATRVAHGELPYVDFPYYYGPLAAFVLGGVALAGGGGLAGFVAAGVVSALALVALTYALARTFVEPLPAALAALVVIPLAFAPTNFGYVLPHTAAMTYGMTALLAMLLALRRRRLVLAGALLGLVTLTKPELAIAAAAAAAVWTVAARPAGRSVAKAAAVAIAIPAAVYGAFLTQVSLHELVYANLDPRDVLQAGGDRLLRLHAPLSPSSFASQAWHVALYALGAAVLLAGGSRRLGDKRRIVVVAVGLAAAMLGFANLEATRTGLQYVYGWIPAGAVLALAVLAASRTRRSPDALALVTALAAVAATTYAAFFFLSPRPQTAVYFAPLAAVFLVALHTRVLPSTAAQTILGIGWIGFLAAAGIALAVKDARTETAVVSGPGGSIRVAPDDAAAYAGALAQVQRTTSAGAPVLFAPQLSALYVIARRTDPLPQISLLPGALSGAPGEQRAIGTLERLHVRVVVIDSRRFTEYGHTSFGGSFDRALATWVERHFARVGTFAGRNHTLVVWRRT